MAEKLLQDEKYALSAFCVEQAAQMQLKYFIGSRLGDFPKTHGLLRLFKECIKLCPELKEFSEKNTTLISHIEDAYVMSRYYDKEYEEAEVKEMLSFYVHLLPMLERCGK
jgi:HEPN domain-containing protein